MLNMLKALIIKLLGGLNEATLNAVFEAAGQENSFTSIKEAAVKNLQAIKQDAMNEAKTAKTEKVSAAKENEAKLTKALQVYTTTVNAANDHLAAVNGEKDVIITTANKKVAAADAKLKLIG